MEKMDLRLGDCLEVMKEIPDGSIDCIITDPPYGTTACKWDTCIPFEPMWKELKRIRKDRTAIALFGSEPFSSALRMSNIKEFKYDWVWEKSKATGFLNSKIRPLVAHENIIIFCKGKTNYYPQKKAGIAYNRGLRGKQSEGDIYGKYNQTEIKSEGPRFPRSVQYFKTSESEGRNYHKTQKPIALLEFLIKTYTLENETVLDFTMGSGTTGVACKNLNRKFIGIEKDETYFNIAKNRIENCNVKNVRTI